MHKLKIKTMEISVAQIPSLQAVFFNPVSYIFYVIYGSLMIWETLIPAKKLPLVKTWRLKGIIAFTLFFTLASYLPLLWDGFLSQYQILDLSSLGTLWGSLIGVLIYELGEYIWHRALHGSNFLWRTSHQMHHSAERLDTFGAFYFSPIDMVGWTALGSFCLVFIAGFSPEAPTFIVLITNFLSIFQHANVKTPQWIGYIVQRPESHSVHHGRGTHAYNYSGLPVYDLIFGTFKNPVDFESETGFHEGSSNRIKEMIMCKDISSVK